MVRTRGDVLDDGCTGCLAGCGHGDGDHVSGGNGDAGEVVCVVGIPLVPCIVSDLGAGSSPVYTGLQNGGTTGISINTNPSGLQVRSV